MYKIGLVVLEEEDENNFRKKLPNEWQVKQVYSQMQLEEESFDLLLFCEQTIDQVAAICEYLLYSKKFTRTLLWIWAMTENESTRKIYRSMGADGVITDQLKPEEWLLILTNQLKRFKNNGNNQEIGSSLVKEKIVLNSRNNTIKIGEQEAVHLTRLEYQVIDLLYQNIGQVMTYEEIGNEIWHLEDAKEFNRYRLSNIVFHLRSKIEKDLKRPKIIKTSRSKGYWVDED